LEGIPERKDIKMADEKNTGEEMLQKALQAAVAEELIQIDEKHYIDELKYAGIKDIIKIGIAFCGKEVAIGYEITHVSY